RPFCCDNVAIKSITVPPGLPPLCDQRRRKCSFPLCFPAMFVLCRPGLARSFRFALPALTRHAMVAKGRQARHDAVQCVPSPFAFLHCLPLSLEMSWSFFPFDSLRPTFFFLFFFFFFLSAPSFCLPFSPAVIPTLPHPCSFGPLLPRLRPHSASRPSTPESILLLSSCQPNPGPVHTVRHPVVLSPACLLCDPSHPPRGCQ
ncbi:hypothetical protein MAPG_03140, partial [Magnaporthiopsis poae ATCC 64411]